MNQSINAAALQNELIRKLKLNCSTSNVNGNNSSNNNKLIKKRTSLNNISKKKDVKCNSCNNISNNENICSKCGFFLKSLHQPIDTLAQRLGLVKGNIPINTVTRSQWDSLEAKLKEPDYKVDTCCPICMEVFNQGTEVLLSCSHIFHRLCLQSFEKFMKSTERNCPICRTGNYQKKLTTIGSKSYEVACAIVIQKYWRRYHIRSKYRSLQRQYYKKNPNNGQESTRKKFYEKEFSILSQKMEKDVDNRKDEVDSMLNTMDKTLRESRELDQLFDFVLQQRIMMNRISNNSDFNDDDDDDINDYKYSLEDNNSNKSKVIPTKVSEREWRDVEVQVRSRARGQGYGECAICMCILNNNNSPEKNIISVKAESKDHNIRKLYLLNCSHLFHSTCLSNFEAFQSSSILQCAVCRAPNYSKKYFVP